jgi:type IV secretion system protein VirB10
MPETVANPLSQATPDPELRRMEAEPRGVFQKNVKPILYLCAAALVITAALFSKTAPKPAGQQDATKQQPPQPTLQDATDNNIQDLKNQVAAAQQRAAQQAANTADPALQGMTAAQQAAAAAYGPGGQSAPCMPGQPCTQQSGYYAQQQLSPAAQAEEQLAAKDRELAYSSRFASNLVYTRTADQATLRQQSSTASEANAVTAGGGPELQIPPAAETSAESSLIRPRPTGEPATNSAAPTTSQRKPEVNIDAATGQPYVIYEGTTLDAILMNRLDGDAPGPVKVLVSNPVYSHDRQHVLVPEGTVVLGEARKIGAAGFGQQRRMAIVFHRLIMPDGYSVDLDQFHGLDQAGEEGAKDKVNNHYLQIFGTSIALGIVSGAALIEQGGGTISTSGSQAFATGASASVSQSATTILDRFIQVPPTITIREGHRVKVYFTQDMLLPAYENHTIPQTF